MTYHRGGNWGADSKNQKMRKSKRLMALIAGASLLLVLLNYMVRGLVSGDVDGAVSSGALANNLKCEMPSPEACAPACLAEFSTWNKQVAELVQRGRKRFANKRVIIAGMIRNAEHTIQQMHCLMKQSVHGAKDHRVIIFENDSTDKTFSIMRGICAADKRTICMNHLGVGLTQGDWGPFGGQRFAKMAQFRNTLLGSVINTEYSTWDAAIFVDMDLLDQAWLPEWKPENGDELPYALGKPPYKFAKTKAQGWNPSILPTVFGFEDTWDVVCANGVWNGGHTYDTLALRTKDFPDTMHNHETQLWPGMLDSRLVFRGAELIPVQSCFGGLSVYNISAMVQTACQYTGGDCEHVTYHKCLRDRQHGYARAVSTPFSRP